MKKQFLLLAALLPCVILSAQNLNINSNQQENQRQNTVNIPDANFKSYLLGNSAINTNNDNEIQLSEANDFTGTISTNNNQSITDLTGIEAFINLSELKLYNNSLTTLDVSSNTKLKLLAFGSNAISNIDVSANTELVQITCSFNALTDLDVSKNTKLEYLYAHNNQLTSIDVRQNPLLTVLTCNNNQLSSIDVTANSLLERLDAQNNQITVVDITSNDSLVWLDVLNNQLVSLNVANGNNTNFDKMSASNNTSLSCIQHDTGFDPATNSNWTKDGAADWSENCVTASIDQAFSNRLVIYPNPAINRLNISSENETIKHIEIFNIYGEKVMSVAKTTIEISDLARGVYFIRIENADNKIAIKQFIKD